MVGRTGDVFQIRISAPAREGKANAALIRFLSEVLGISRSRLKIVRGEQARDKRIWIESPGAAAAVEKLDVEMGGKADGL